MEQVEGIVARTRAEGIGAIKHLPAHDLTNFMGNDRLEIVLVYTDTVLIVGKDIRTAAEADIAVRIVACTAQSQSFSFGGRHPPLSIDRARRRQTCRGGAIADGVGIGDKRVP